MKSLMPLYILQIIDGGILRHTVPEFDLVRLADIAEVLVSNYLLESGAKEEGDIAYKTDDGYAVILHVPGDPVAPRVSLWTYRFDGQEEVAQSLSIIQGQILRLNCEMFVISANALQSRIVEAVSSWQLQTSDNADFNGAMLADCILAKISETDNGLYREWGM